MIIKRTSKMIMMIGKGRRRDVTTCSDCDEVGKRLVVSNNNLRVPQG